MYYVQEDNWHLFFWENPADRGYVGEVTEVDVDYDRLTIHEWPKGSAAPEQWVGIKEGTQYKVFRSRRECEYAGYEPIGMNLAVFESWEDWCQLRPAIEV